AADAAPDVNFVWRSGGPPHFQHSFSRKDPFLTRRVEPQVPRPHQPIHPAEGVSFFERVAAAWAAFTHGKCADHDWHYLGDRAGLLLLGGLGSLALDGRAPCAAFSRRGEFCFVNS